MTTQEYLSKMEILDVETKERFDKIFADIYPHFRKLSYSKLELFLEDFKRTLKKDSYISGQLWEFGSEPTV
uniref:hypothetical protein n=1 Tax=Gelidibacter sp. TaxID=2018083 RepID=UPI004048F8BC